MLLVDDPARAAQRFCSDAVASAYWNSAGDTCRAYANGATGEAGASLYNMVGGANPNAWAGRKVTENSLAFLGIPFDPPGTGQRILRIVNVRANASALAPPSGNIIPLNVTMYVAITGTGSLNLQNTTINVGYVQYGLAFASRNLSNSDASSVTFQQCAPNNTTMGDSTPTGCPDFRLRFTERFSTAFRHATTAVTANAQDSPGTIYNTEHMFAVDPSNTGSDGGNRGKWSTRGWATQGTRFLVRFKDIPANVDIYVTNGQLSSTGQLNAVILNADGSGNATSTLGSAAGSINCTVGGSSGNRTATSLFALQTDSFTGAKYAVWEVTPNATLALAGSDPSRIEEITFGVAVRTRNTSSAQSALGTVTVTGNYAPTPSTDPASDQASKWANMSTSYPVPRFIENPISATTFTINPCRTNLLFTYVTQNTTGAQLWDTGVAVANTLKDPFKTVAQQGKCTVFYYTSPDLVAPSAQTTNADVRPGDVLLFSLYAGGNFGIQPVKDFTGYIIVQCNFQGAHGYAFISDLGAARVAEGYLGLVMDPPAMVRVTGVTTENLVH